MHSATTSLPVANERGSHGWSELGATAVNAVIAAGEARSLLVVSAAAGEGRTTTAATLGWACSRLGSTLLVDAHVGQGGLSLAFEQPVTPGLSDLLAGGVDLGSAVRPTRIENLHILPCGSRPTVSRTALAMFQGDGFAKLLQRLLQDYDRIVCDTPPFLGDPAAAALGAHFDGAVLVLACSKTRWEVARLVQQQLEAAGGRLVGAVLNRRKYYIPAAVYRAL